MKLQTLIKSLKPGFSNRKSRRRAGRHAGLPVPAVESLEPRALLAATIGIAPSATSVAAAAESSVSTNVNFDIELTDGSVAPLSFQVRMHYDSSELTPDLNAITSSAFAPAGYQLETSINDESRLADDGRDETDKFVLLSWGERSDQTPFPVSNENTPLTLFTASFQTSRTFDGTQVDFRGPSVLVTGNTDPANRSLVALNLTPLELTLQTNASPTLNQVAPTAVAENQTSAVTVVASDSDGDTLTYSLTGTDAALFSIDNTGVVTFNAAPNFESPGDSGADNIHNFTVAVSDGNGGSATQDVVVTVTDVNENPVIISSGSASVAENQIAGYVVTATDDDNDTPTYAITGGADAALFAINSTTGAVTFNTAPDFENPDDAGANNVYNIQVTANDGTVNSTPQNVAITVTDVTETLSNRAPVISSAITASAAENQTSAYTVTATDADNDTLTYAISGGADAALFNIVSSTGVVTFAAAPDFENPNDAGANNVYNIQVTTNDGTVNSTPQNVAITVTDINEQSGNTGILQGRKFNDLNGNGIRESDEPYLNGWTIQLVNSAGAVVDTQTTADRAGEVGWYRFDAAPGTYSLREVQQDGWIQTAPFNDLAVRASRIDSQFNLRATQNDFLDWGGRNEKWLLGDNGWHFITPDGALYQWDNSPRTALTGSLVAGGQFSPSYYQNSELLYNAALAQEPTYTIATGQAHPDVFFGNQNVSQPGTIRGRKWHDLNGDGQRTPDEPWLNGWTFELVSGPGSVAQTVTTTDVDLDGNGRIDPETETGWYQFENVPAGQWIVREQQQPGWIQTSAADATEREAWQLDQDLNLQLRRSLFTNWGGLNERWVRGDDAWYYITPNGEFFRWDNSPRTNLTGTRIATLSSDYHADPARLYDADNPFEMSVTITPGEDVDGVNFGNQEADSGVSSEFDGRGNVSVRVFGRHLILTGDNVGNGILIHNNSDGFVTVSPIGNTTVNGEHDAWTVNGWTTVPGDIRANLHGGDDAVIVSHLAVGMDVEVNTGNDNDYLLVQNAQIGRNLDYRAAAGDNTIAVRDSTIGNVARVRTGNGSDAAYTNNVTVGGRVVISTAGGNDLFASRSSTFNRNLSINTGSDDDYLIAFEDNDFRGRLAANGSSGSDAVHTDDRTSFARMPTVRNFEENSIAVAEGLLDSVMQRLVDVGLDDLLE